MAAERILLVSGDFPPSFSGVGDYTDKLAAALHEAGADVTVLTTASDNAGDSRRPFPVLRTISRWGLSQRKAILAACRQGFDIVHLQYPGVSYGRGPMINLLPAMLRMGPDAPRTVLTVHDFRVMRRRWRARMAPMMWAVNGIVHVDEKDWPWIRAWGVSENKPHTNISIAANVDPLPVDDASRRQWRTEFGFADDETVIAFFGILYPHKGISELLEAVKDTHGQGRKVRLLVLGDFDRQAPWRAGMEQMLADPLVRWERGATLEQVSRGLHAADLAALPFHSGASTNRSSMLAALDHGLPTITTNGPATPSGFDKMFDLLLVPVNDRAALAAAIARLMDNPPLRARMRESALARRRTWASIAADTIAFYESLDEGKAPAADVRGKSMGAA
jgi:glycosyltransferase involved in cell wall biosynthesis